MPFCARGVPSVLKSVPKTPFCRLRQRDKRGAGCGLRVAGCGLRGPGCGLRGAESKFIQAERIEHGVKSDKIDRIL